VKTAIGIFISGVEASYLWKGPSCSDVKVEG